MCPPVNCDKSGVNCDKSGVNCGGIKGYQGYQSSGHVSLFHLPTRHESGSYAKISNGENDAQSFPYTNGKKGNSIF